ncbi:MAG: cytochrome c5 family protein [Proteobacteria bacterium]|nr:cytochrome c5 family protein [Pseudomonadota bacterium]HQR03931.1 c-type cytochrome [Rhodocyclaceae bacterium]
MSDTSNPNFVPLVLGSLVVMGACITIAVVVGGDAAVVDAEAVNARILPVAKVELAAAGAAEPGQRTGEQMFESACKACHGAGVLGAPKVGSNSDWAPRLGKGLAGLLKSAINGTPKGMPPKGGVGDATDDELARAIVYMANKSGGNLKEPK